jgi:pimeloyl-ACP methyl ester carboxylesterase
MISVQSPQENRLQSSLEQSRQFLWIGTNPSFQCFHRSLLTLLGQEFSLKYWEYSQTADEPADLQMALQLLHEYLQTAEKPIHLIGHGQGGALALSYGRCYPRRVGSLCLLSVAVQPSITWQAYYYQQLATCNDDRRQVLQRVASHISNVSCPKYVRHLADRLDRDLLEAPTSSSLWQMAPPLTQGSIAQPLLVCGASDDPVLAGHVFGDWSQHLKLGDRLWQQPNGGHFFHHQQAVAMAAKVGDFWRSLDRVLPCQLPLRTTFD